MSSGARATPDGTSHHTVGRYPALDAFLERRWLCEQVSHYFGGAPYIQEDLAPATVAPGGQSYLHNVHRDVRTHAGDFHFMLNMLVMVDAFTLENGATHVLTGSHRETGKPAEDRFRDQSDRLVGPAGSIVLFDSNLWHSAGSNVSDATRVALTLSFSRAFVKQQMDYLRFSARPMGAASRRPCASSWATRR